MKNKKFTRSKENNMQKLFQEHPYRRCTYIRHKSRSFTDCHESFQNGVNKEASIMRWNKRIPTKEIVWHLLIVLSADEINALRLKVFRYLKDHGLEGVATIELTKGKNGRANNCIHFHCLTDDPRNEVEIRALFNRACERDGFVKGQDFRIDYRNLYDGEAYFSYFTKSGEQHTDEVILFQPRLLESGRTLQKFYQIGNWFGKSKKEIWNDIKKYLASKDGTDPDKKGCANATEQSMTLFPASMKK